MIQTNSIRFLKKNKENNKKVSKCWIPIKIYKSNNLKDEKKKSLYQNGYLMKKKKAFSVRFPYSPANEKFSKLFMRKVENFTNDK